MPQAQQVADRWHLLHHLGEALVKALEVHANALRKLPNDESASVSVQPAPASAEVEPVSPAKPTYASSNDGNSAESALNGGENASSVA